MKGLVDIFTVKAMIHSLKAQDDVVILHLNGNNDVIAEYKGVRYSAIFNPFVCLYYVDDIYGRLPDQNKCHIYGELLAETE